MRAGSGAVPSRSPCCSHEHMIDIDRLPRSDPVGDRRRQGGRECTTTDRASDSHAVVMLEHGCMHVFIVRVVIMWRGRDQLSATGLSWPKKILCIPDVE
jgi:hypothetical protein